MIPIYSSVDAWPPMERLPLSDLTITNNSEKLNVDDQAKININYGISTDREQEFAILFQVRDGNGVVVLLNWITGSDRLQPYSEYICGLEICSEGGIWGKKPISTSWIPSQAGYYEIAVFAWESVDNPTALSPPITINAYVENQS